MVFVINLLCLEAFLSHPPQSKDVYIFPCLPQKAHKVLEHPMIFQKCRWRVLFNKTLQALEENLIKCGKKIHPFGVQISRLFSLQPNDQVDSESLWNTLLLHLINHGHSLNVSNDQKNADAEKVQKEAINVFNQTDFDTSTSSHFLQIISYQHRTDIVATQKIFYSKLQLISLHWFFNPMTNSPLWKVIDGTRRDKNA